MLCSNVLLVACLSHHSICFAWLAYGCQMLRWVFERLLRAKNTTVKNLEMDTLMMTLGMEQMLGVKNQTELAKSMAQQEQPSQLV